MAELESFCKAGNPTYSRWSPPSSTCISWFSDTKTYDDAESACIQSAPPGTTGRLFHAVHSSTADLDIVFGSTSANGWVGGKRYIKGQTGWNPGMVIGDFRYNT